MMVTVKDIEEYNKMFECPKCETGVLIKDANWEGIVVLRCNKCHFSMMFG